MDSNDFYLTLFGQLNVHERLPHPGDEIFIIEKLDRKKKAIRFSRQPLDKKTGERREKQYYSFKDFGQYWDILNTQWGKTISTESLKHDFPDVFSNKKKGYNCMSIFMFMVLQFVGLITKIGGSGTPESPYMIKLPSDPDKALAEVLLGRQYNHSMMRLGDDYAMVAGEAKDILILVLPLADNESVEQVEAELDRFDLVVEYESAYKEHRTLDTRTIKQGANNPLNPEGKAPSV